MKVSNETFFFYFKTFLFIGLFGIITKISISYLFFLFMSSKTKLSLVAIGLLAVSLGAFWYFNRNSLQPITTQPVAPATSLEQTNLDTQVSKEVEPVREVALAKPQEKVKLSENAEFTISGGSPTSTIRFYEGSITPLDVHVGDTQDFRIVVSSDNGIKRVVAEIETDFGYDYVELKKDRVISILDTIPNRYAVNSKNNTLKILNDTELARARNAEYQKELAQKKGNQANASLGQREVWIGSWLVNKVHDKVYHTNFIAYDSAGNQEKITMAWSDKCSIPLGGSWTSASTSIGCALVSGDVDGVANGTTTLAYDKSLTLPLNSTFLWYTGKSVVFDGGELIVNTGGQMKQVGTIYVKDQDNDRYIAPGNLGTTQTSTALTNWHARQNMLGENDCADTNAAINPGAEYHNSPIAGLSGLAAWDWDCSGTVQKSLDISYAPPPGNSWQFCMAPEDPEYINLETEVGTIDFGSTLGPCDAPCSEWPQPYVCKDCTEARNDLFNKWSKIENSYNNIKYLSLNNLWIINSAKAEDQCCQSKEENCSGSFNGCCDGVSIPQVSGDYSYCGVTLYPGIRFSGHLHEYNCYGSLNECSGFDNPQRPLITGDDRPLFCK